MFSVKKLKYLLPVIFLLPLSSIVNVAGSEQNSEVIEETATKVVRSADAEDYVELYRTDNYIYSYKEELDIIMVQDEKTEEILWKTGADVPYISASQAAKTCKEKLAEDPDYVCDPFEETYGNAIMNSLVTAYFYKENDSSYNVLYTVSSADDYYSTDSTLMRINNSDNHYRLDVDFSKKVGISLSVHIYLNDDGIEFEIRNDEIGGDNVNRLVQLTIAPYIGATGGEVSPFNYEEQKYDTNTLVSKEYVDGYIVVPDGSGSIIPFKDNSVQLGVYKSYVYGQNYTNLTNNQSPESLKSNVPLKDASIPLYGIVHNETEKNVQKAIAAFATQGEEYMAINVSPDKANNDEYVYAYATFATNFSYTEYYSQDGTQSAPVLCSTPFDYDIGLRFNFIEGDNATYVGIAQNYREYLMDVEKQISKQNNSDENITTRLDFIMADAEDSVIGSTNAIVTTADDVNNILNDTYENGVENIVTSLLGWQDGGVTLGRPDKAKFTSKIGSAKDFKKLISAMKKKDIEVSFSQDYYLINESQISFSGNATKHYNGKYIEFVSYNYNYIYEFGYARSDASLDWVKSQNSTLRKKTNVDAMTVTGISNHVLSHYKGSREDAMEDISNAFKYLDSHGKVNAEMPNKYLWKYVDRYFNIPVTDSQHLIEEEEVPLLQLVLNGCMELYAPYSNFSFYDQESILKMIDFNVYPSFVLSQESSHYLSYTNSANYYSTEYTLYKDLIKNIYTQVNSALGNVINADWVSRVKLDNGLIVNEYSNGKKIVINYSNTPLTYSGTTVPSQGFEVL